MKSDTKLYTFLFSKSSVERLQITVECPADADDDGELGGIVTNLVIESFDQDDWFLKHCDVSLDRQAIIDSQDGQAADFTLVRNANGELELDEKPDSAPRNHAVDEELAAMIVSVLTGVEGGMTLPDLTVTLLTMGYKPQSQNVGQVVYNALSMLKREGRVSRDDKKYRLVVCIESIPSKSDDSDTPQAGYVVEFSMMGMGSVDVAAADEDGAREIVNNMSTDELLAATNWDGALEIVSAEANKQ